LLHDLLGPVLGYVVVILCGVQVEVGVFIRRCLAVGTQGGHRTAIDDFVDSGLLAGAHDVARAFLVDAVHQSGVRQPVGIKCGQMIDGVAAFHGTPQGFDIVDIAAPELQAQAVQVLYAAGLPYQAANVTALVQ